MIEAIFKAVGRALDNATKIDPDRAAFLPLKGNSDP
jgi:imidazoleglycerol phosphate dehydratase HisB